MENGIAEMLYRRRNQHRRLTRGMERLCRAYCRASPFTVFYRQLSLSSRHKVENRNFCRNSLQNCLMDCIPSAALLPHSDE
ncbi:hypothetical protein [Steroidobacter denitrificans]|uniref:hypothetical protein n=1 Tax=Steroidobacter denitrificans TaxID=465721 RepID=UPI00143C0061|nr:hypothetical protein [Steroidobacter denitrificans]